MDHQQLLGDTLEKIAFEKAGIIKHKIPLVIGEYQEQVSKVFEQRAHDLNAHIHFADKIWTTNYIGELVLKNKPYQVFHYKSNTDQFELKTDQLGIYQEHNCKTVLASIALLQELGFHQITKESILTSFENVTSLTGLRGRWQIISFNPTIVADTGHNVHGISYIVAQLAKQSAKTLRMVIGFVNDKSISEVLQMLPKHAVYYFTQAAIPRAKPAAEIYLEAIDIGLSGTVYDSTAAAFQQAKQDAEPDDFIFIGGSTFVVAELI
jgi:dihydrofolate synthase/folylpolyglutamate synthase